MAAIGKYKERVEIYTRTQSKDEFGQAVATYSLLYTLWARYLSTGGSEAFETKEKTARNYAEFSVRYQGLTLDATMRLVWKGETFDIQAIEQTEFRNYYTLKCISKDND